MFYRHWFDIDTSGDYAAYSTHIGLISSQG